ncbi:MAG: family 10 glycosylhydrolase [Bacteroidales bacterium]|nr:family 10 glycosylhydrolase [Bacteroidales bacterium]
MKRFLLFFLIAHFSFLISTAQPGRELRGTWFTTAWRIDWPPIGSAEVQKNKLVEMFNSLEAANINAVFFQVRPFADAFYQSAYEPWSHLLGPNLAARGVDPGYDPLAFAIKEAHKRGMELHVWLNPYRFESNAGEFAGRPGDYSQTHPHLIINYSGRTYFDPGHPETTQLIKSIVADIVNNYDIDGVIFDDYFYPSNMPASYDQATFDAFGNEAFIRHYYDGPLFQTLTRGDFRRASVNNMIKEVNDTIKSINPALVFGVSPAGIYTTNSLVAQYYETTLPPGITGNNNWATINCDPLAWMKEGAIDYISPQLYWQIGGSQDFVTLTQWWGWQGQRYGRHHYPSLGAYRLYTTKSGEAFLDAAILQELGASQENSKDTPDKNNWPVTEIGNQIIANRNSSFNDALGLVFYNTNSLLSLSKDLAGYLASDLFSEKSIFPQLAWLPNPDFGTPEIIDIASLADDPELAVFNIDSEADRFIVYGWNELPPTTKNNNADFVQVAFKNTFSTILHRNYPYFAVAEYSRNRLIGPSSAYQEFFTIDPPAIALLNGANVCEGEEVFWPELPGIGEYQIVFFSNPFDDVILFRSPVFAENYFTIDNSWFAGQQTYYYRVMAREGDVGSYSQTDYFTTGYPATTVINSPEQGQINVNFSTVAQWNLLPEATSYKLQVALDSLFAPGSLVIDRSDISQNISNISLEAANTDHYLRVAGVNSCGTGQWSQVVKFTTTSGVFVEERSHKVLSIYPNPAGNRAYLPYPGEIGKRNIALYNTSGQLVMNFDRTDGSGLDEIDISSLAPGFYTGQVSSENGIRFTFKMIKTNR